MLDIKSNETPEKKLDKSGEAKPAVKSTVTESQKPAEVVTHPVATIEADKAAADMSKSLVDRLMTTFESYEGIWDKFKQYEGEDQNARSARLRVKSQFVTGVDYAFKKELAKLDPKASNYAEKKSELDKRMDKADKILDSYLKTITEKTEKSGGNLSPESLAQALSQATKIVELMTSSELADAGMTEVLGYVLKTGEGTEEESFKLLSEWVGDENKRGYAVTMLVLMSSQKRVEFAKKYLTTKAKNGNEKELLINLNKIGGISPREIGDALAGTDKALTPEELKTCQESWGEFGEFRQIADRIGKDDYGASNIGDQFNAKTLVELVAKGAGFLNVVLSGILHNKELFDGNFADFFKSLAPGIGMMATGSAINSDGKVNKIITAKTEAETQRDARKSMLEIYDKSPNGWYKFFEKEEAVMAFSEYVKDSKKKSSDVLKKESLNIAGFIAYMKAGEPSKENKYKATLEDFETKVKEKTTTGMDDKSLQDMAEIFNVLAIDNTNYKDTLEEVKKTA